MSRFGRHPTPSRPWPILVVAWALLTWAGLYLLTGERYLPVRIGLAMAPWMMGVVCLTVALTAAYRLWGLGLALTILASGLFAAQAQPLWRGLTEPALAYGADVDAVEVVTLSNRTRNGDMAATARTIAGLNADVVLLQEIADPAQLLQHLSARGGWHACTQRTYMILSRFSVTSPAQASGPNWLICDVALPGGRVSVVSAHFPRPTSDAPAQLAVAGNIAAWVMRQKGPVILGGDLNATPLSEAYRQVAAPMSDAFEQAGRGFGFTFPTPARRLGKIGPFLRIDYVLFNDAFQARYAAVLPDHAPQADHFPVRVQLTWRRPVPGPVLSQARP